MIAKAVQKNVHVSYRKAKIVCDLIRNKNVKDALTILELTKKKSAKYLINLLNQVIANATNNHAMAADKLYVYEVVANQGATLKRTQPRAKGSADLLKKRHTHFYCYLSDDPNERKNAIAKIKAKVKKRSDNNKKEAKALALENKSLAKTERTMKLKLAETTTTTKTKETKANLKDLKDTKSKLVPVTPSKEATTKKETKPTTKVKTTTTKPKKGLMQKIVKKNKGDK